MAADDAHVIGPLERILEDQVGAGTAEAGEVRRAERCATTCPVDGWKPDHGARLQTVLGGESIALRQLQRLYAAVGAIEAEAEIVEHTGAAEVGVAQHEMARVEDRIRR